MIFNYLFKKVSPFELSYFLVKYYILGLPFLCIRSVQQFRVDKFIMVTAHSKGKLVFSHNGNFYLFISSKPPPTLLSLSVYMSINFEISVTFCLLQLKWQHCKKFFHITRKDSENLKFIRGTLFYGGHFTRLVLDAPKLERNAPGTILWTI